MAQNWLLKFGFTKCDFFSIFFSHNHNVIINLVLARILTSIKFPNISNQSLTIKKNPKQAARYWRNIGLGFQVPKEAKDGRNRGGKTWDF